MYYIYHGFSLNMICTMDILDLMQKIILVYCFRHEDILFSNYTSFRGGTELYPHRDPDILRYPYKRIQIPLSIPDNNKCYMEWTDSGARIIWEEGQPQVCEVMNYTHHAFNKSDKPMDFLFVDVKLDTEVMINN